jgi:hypothetical protein
VNPGGRRRPFRKSVSEGRFSFIISLSRGMHGQVVSGRLGQIRWKSASAVNEGDNDGPTGLKVADHAAVADQKFTNVFNADFRNDSASRRELPQRSCRIASLLDKSGSVAARVSRDETGCALEFLPGGIRPDYPASQRSIRTSTSSRSISISCSASSWPRSILSRT